MDSEECSDKLLFKIIDGSTLDQQSLADYLTKSTIESVLKFESEHGTSPLVRCVQNGVSHLDLVRCMVNSGLYDYETIDNTGRAALTNLASEWANDEQNIKNIIDVVVKDVDQATACYKLLKLNSLPLFKAYLKVHDEEGMFQSITIALTKLNVKRILLAYELRLFIQLKLGDYGYRKQTGDWTAFEQSDSWKNHIEAISDCWRDIVTHGYDTNDNVDNRFLHLLLMIHNHLYFIKFKKFLEHLPIWEIVFCVAIFINIYKTPLNHRFYRLMLSKRNVIAFLEAIVPALERVKGELVKIERVLGTIATDMDGSKYDALINELVIKLEASTIKNKTYMADKFRTMQENGTRSKNELANDITKVFKKADKSYFDTKLEELKALESRDVLIGKIKTQLKRVVHPENVCNRLIAEVKNRTPIDTIVANIIASETINLADVPLLPGVMETIAQRYSQMKQFYSMAKIQNCISIITKVDSKNHERFPACVKRILTVIGEAINNTKNTPNMPDTRVYAAVQRMFMYQFKDLNIWHRNTYTHELSRNRLEIDEQQEQILLNQLPQHMRIIGVMLELLLIAIGAVMRHTFYGMLYGCETLESLRALLTYVGEEDILAEVENDWWDDVSMYYKQARALLDQVRLEPLGQTSQFEQVEHSFNVQWSIIKDLAQMAKIEEEFNYESVRKTCFACNNLSTVKCLLSWKLHSYNPCDTLERISKSWDADIPHLSDIAWANPQLLQLNPAAASTTLAMLQNALISVNQYNNGEHTRTLIKDLACIDLQTVDEKEWQMLNEKLAPYYTNVFQLDVKWSVLKEFCAAKLGKASKKMMDFEKVQKKLRRQDADALQEMFDDRRKKLKLFFKQCGIEKEEDLIAKFFDIPPDARAAMEYVQVELCEMLIAAKHFGDNFQALKHSILWIQGKSYRNYLAHDALSYDLLTCSGDEKCVINAFIFANTPVSLFSDRSAMRPMIDAFPSHEDTKRWIDEQLELRATFATEDARRIHATLQAGGEMQGHFYGHHSTQRLSIRDLIEWSNLNDPTFVALLKRYFLIDKANDRNSERNAPALKDSEEGYDELSNRLSDWCKREGWQNVLMQLLDDGNERCALQVINDSESLIATETDSNFQLTNALLYHPMLRGLCQSARCLFSKMRCPKLASKTVELAIVVHWNDLLQHHSAKSVLDDDSNKKDFIHAAVKVCNYEAIGYFLNRDGSRTNLILRESYLAAACYGNCTVLERLFEHYSPGMDGSLLNIPLHRAAVNKHWDCVRFLLNQNAAADVVFFDTNGNESCTLLILIEFGMVDLIRCINSFNRLMFCSTSTEHPISVASDYDTLSEEMIEAIESLGFGFLDNPKVLHATVEEGEEHLLWNEVWEQIDSKIGSHPFRGCNDRFKLLVKVLCRWRWITFIEKPYDGNTALSCAVAADNELNVLQELINRARLMRTLEDDQLILGDLAIRNGSAIVRFGSEHQYDELCITTGCREIASRVRTLHERKTELQWEDFSIDIGALSVKFSALNEACVLSNAGSNLRMRDTTSLADNLHDLLTISDALFSKQCTVYATLSQGTRTIHFLRIEDWCCAFDVFPPDSKIDLSSMLNTRLKGGKTVIYNAIKYGCKLESIKLLAENGANPLLADANGYTAISAAIEHTIDPAFALSLMEACVANNLRNEDGCFLTEMTDGPGHHTLLKLAVEWRHQKAVQFLRHLQSGHL